MGLDLGGITDSLFGGEDNSAQKKQTKLNKEAIQFIKDQLSRSRGEIQQGYPLATDVRTQGNQSVADLLGGSAGARYSPFMQGNANAQNTLSGMGSQIQNALMGMPVDYSFSQPKNVTPDTSWMNVQMPRSQGLSALFEEEPATNTQPAPQNPLENISSLALRGIIGRHSALPFFRK